MHKSHRISIAAAGLFLPSDQTPSSTAIRYTETTCPPRARSPCQAIADKSKDSLKALFLHQSFFLGSVSCPDTRVNCLLNIAGNTAGSEHNIAYTKSLLYMQHAFQFCHGSLNTVHFCKHSSILYYRRFTYTFISLLMDY